MLNFDEFRAVSQREKNKNRNDASNETSTPSDVAVKKPTNASLSSSLGGIMESSQAQWFCIALILLDFVMAFLLLVLKTIEQDRSRNHFLVPFATFLPSTYIVLKSFLGFGMVFMSFEYMMVLLSFGVSSLFHVGYLLDLVVLGCQAYLEIKGFGIESRILSPLRFWRIVRLSAYYIRQEALQHQETKESLEQITSKLRRVEVELVQEKQEVQREKEAKEAVESLVQSYREEVDTLNEALKIAAMDIAEVAQGDEDEDIFDDEENEFEDESEIMTETASQVPSFVSGMDESMNESHAESEVKSDDEFEDASVSAFDKSRNKEKLMKLASDAASVKSSVSSKRSNNITFLVNSDGSFQKK